MAIRGNTTNELLAESPNTYEVEVASKEILKENLGRSGSQWVNNSGNSIYLGLGKAAVEHEGIFLAPSGSWDGMVGGMVWTGSVFAKASGANSKLTVVVV